MGREDKDPWELKEGENLASGELELRICVQLDLDPDSTT